VYLHQCKRVNCGRAVKPTPRREFYNEESASADTDSRMHGEKLWNTAMRKENVAS